MTKLMAVVLVGVLGCGGDDDGGTAIDAGNGGDGGGDGGGIDGGGGGLDGGTAAGAACADFPATFAMGPTIVPTLTGAVICSGASASLCRATNNTYSDGDGACAAGTDDLFVAYDTSGATSRYLRIVRQGGWSFISQSHGTVIGDGIALDGLPDGTAITVVLGYEANQYELVFAYDGTDVTFTSFTRLD